MNLIDIYDFTGGIQKLTLGEILRSNQISQKYGLALTAPEAQEIIEWRDLTIKNHGRVELGVEVINKIITAFCSSSYIEQDQYVSIINELVAIFYYMKNETEDQLGDDELISTMEEFFNTSCHGSVELLRDREMTLLAINLRQANQQADYARERRPW